MKLTNEELAVLGDKLAKAYEGLHELELYKSDGAELKRCYCLGMETLYFKVLELAGYDEKQRLDMYHKLTSR